MIYIFIKKMLTVLILVGTVILNMGCGSTMMKGETSESSQDSGQKTSWAIYWYLCGSDLESAHGSASADLAELKSVKLPQDVKVVIQTGGAQEWSDASVEAQKLCRFVYSSNGMELQETLAEANMGDSDTLTDFLNYCYQQHPAEHTMVILWNHGGGVLGGVAYDERYGMDSLSMPELEQGLSASGHHADIIGFDACLMATLDTARRVKNFADYMTASQEWEPGNGWNYEGILKALKDDSQITPRELGTVLCDTYMEGCRAHQTDAEATLSLIDLSACQPLFDVVEENGERLFRHALTDETLFAAMGRAASSSENYGGNNKSEGYSNLVDLGSYFDRLDFLPEKEITQIKEALAACTIYQRRGSMRKDGCGLSFYYPYDHSIRGLMNFRRYSQFVDYGPIYDYLVSGKLSGDSLNYVKEKGINDDALYATQITIDKMGLENYPVNVTEDGKLVLELGNKLDYLASIGGYLYQVDFDSMKLCGIGNEMVSEIDWNRGSASVRYRDHWWYLNGHLIYGLLVQDREDTALYSVPVKINGESVFLRVSWNRSAQKAIILGARGPIQENGMADRNVIFPKKGDTITTMIYQSSMDSDEENELKEYETFVLEQEPEITYQSLPDGLYVWLFDMNDPWGNYTTSDMILYEIKEGIAGKEGFE